MRTHEEWLADKKKCEESLEGHHWIEMSEKEAYPLPAGIKCTKCRTSKVGFSVEGLKKG